MPERAAIVTLTGGFLAEFEALAGDWRRRCLNIVEQWPEDISAAEPDWETLQNMASLGAETRAVGR